jgi:poly(A) polymerase
MIYTADNIPSEVSGVSQQVSFAQPTATELELNGKLGECVARLGLVAPKADLRVREKVLGKLDKILRELVQATFRSHGFSEEDAAAAGVLILTFGSYRLGVAGPGADVDTLCVVPNLVDNDIFFDEIVPKLGEMSEVTELVPVPGAYVPICKMVFGGVDIDLVPGRLLVKTLPPKLDLLDNAVLSRIDDNSIRSFNGVRVTDSILRVVPSRDTFRLALRAIKHWARKRGVYSNVLGYLGGVSWAMLTARVCQLYPNACAAFIVNRFFRVYHEWKWPSPVELTATLTRVGDLSYPVWNPRMNPLDRRHLMPIITPAYPAMNSTYNVSRSTKAVLLEEFQEGANITYEIMQKRAPWSALFLPVKFFESFKYYLMIEAAAESEDALGPWSGFVESRLRRLITKLEEVEHVSRIRPFPKKFAPPVGENVEHRTFGHAATWFVGFEVTRARNVEVNLTVPTHLFRELSITNEPKFYKPEENAINFSLFKQRDLPEWLLESLREEEEDDEEQLVEAVEESAASTAGTTGTAGAESAAGTSKESGEEGGSRKRKQDALVVPPQTPTPRKGTGRSVWDATEFGGTDDPTDKAEEVERAREKVDRLVLASPSQLTLRVDEAEGVVSAADSDTSGRKTFAQAAATAKQPTVHATSTETVQATVESQRERAEAAVVQAQRAAEKAAARARISDETVEAVTVCRLYNGHARCDRTACKFSHVCGACGGPHPSATKSVCREIWESGRRRTNVSREMVETAAALEAARARLEYMTRSSSAGGAAPSAAASTRPGAGGGSRLQLLDESDDLLAPSSLVRERSKSSKSRKNKKPKVTLL